MCIGFVNTDCLVIPNSAPLHRDNNSLPLKLNPSHLQPHAVEATNVGR